MRDSTFLHAISRHRCLVYKIAVQRFGVNKRKNRRFLLLLLLFVGFVVVVDVDVVVVVG